MSSNDLAFEVRLSGPETDLALFDDTDVESLGSVQRQNSSFVLPVTLSKKAGSEVSTIFHTAGVPENPEAFEIIQLYGNKARQFRISPPLAEAIANRDWDCQFLLTFEQREQAADLRETLGDG